MLTSKNLDIESVLKVKNEINLKNEEYQEQIKELNESNM